MAWKKKKKGIKTTCAMDGIREKKSRQSETKQGQRLTKATAQDAARSTSLAPGARINSRSVAQRDTERALRLGKNGGAEKKWERKREKRASWYHQSAGSGSGIYSCPWDLVSHHRQPYEQLKWPVFIPHAQARVNRGLARIRLHPVLNRWFQYTHTHTHTHTHVGNERRTQ